MPPLLIRSQLKKLDLANTRIEAYAIDVRLFEAIRDMHLLEELNLLNWTFTEEQIFIALSNKLRLHTAVIRGYNASLMRLPPLPSLTDLDASRLSINFEALATITSLTRLDLSNLGRDVGTFQEFHTLLPLTRLKVKCPIIPIEDPSESFFLRPSSWTWQAFVMVTYPCSSPDFPISRSSAFAKTTASPRASGLPSRIDQASIFASNRVEVIQYLILYISGTTSHLGSIAMITYKFKPKLQRRRRGKPQS